MTKYKRLQSLPKDHSFFLFGPRGSGKTTLIKAHFIPSHTLFIDLLDSEMYERFFYTPHELYKIVTSLSEVITHVVIDEVQKIPELLNEVHRLIENTNKIFVLTGSSARKLKRGGANLLAGRAFVYHLAPLSYLELQEHFDLDSALLWGTLPKITLLKNDKQKAAYLRSYAHTYLKEEIADEQLVRKLDTFRRFIEVAAQCNGKIINYAQISRDVGLDDKTVANYFTILEDTMIGFFLEAHHNSFRKRFLEKPKFYFFDPGVVRAVSRCLSSPLTPQTTAYGNAFEHFIIIEIQKICSIFAPDFRMGYLKTTSGAEIDLVIDRPGDTQVFIEIKSRTRIQETDISTFSQLTKDIPNSQAIVLSQDRFTKKIGHVTSYPWQQGIEEIFQGYLVVGRDN